MKRCWCDEGWYFNTKANACKRMNCLADEKWSWRWLKCIPGFCPKLMTWSQDDGVCVCVPGRYWSKRMRRCAPRYCKAGKRFSFLEEKCITVMNAPCPNRKHERNDNGLCVCRRKYTKGRILGKGEYTNPDTCQVGRYNWCPTVKRCPGFLKKWDKSQCACKDIF